LLPPDSAALHPGYGFCGGPEAQWNQEEQPI